MGASVPPIPRVLSPDEFEHAQTLSPASLGKANFPVLPPPYAPRDATAGVNPTTGKDERSNPNAQKLTGLPRILTQYVAAPILDHPLTSALITGTPGAGIVMSGLMGKDIVEYAAQVAAEQSLAPADRARAQSDPDRIPGERAAVEGAMLGAVPAVRGAIKAGKGLTSMMGSAGRLVPDGVAGDAAIARQFSPEQMARASSTLTDVAQDAGLRGFGAPDAPTVSAPLRAQVQQHAADVTTALQTMTAPMTRGGKPLGPRQAAQMILRSSTGEMAAQYEQAAFKVDEFRRSIEPLPMEDKLGFVDAIEGGRSQAAPEFQPIADYMRQQWDLRKATIQGLNPGALDHYIENYFSHSGVWEDPEQAGGVFKAMVGSKRPMEGSKAFLKTRVFPTIMDGIQAGAKLNPEFNPADVFLMSIRDQDKYIMAHTAFQEAQSAGFMQYVKAGELPPDGYVAINDKLATVFGPKQGAVSIPAGALKPISDAADASAGMQPMTPGDVTIPGRRIMGAYYAPKEAAMVFNNYLSPGFSDMLRNTFQHGDAYAKVFDAYRGLGNFMNQAQLGLSAFHLGFTSMDAIVSRTALGLEYIGSGKPLEGLGKIISAPAAPVTNAMLGAKIRRAYLQPETATPDMMALANAVKEAGGRVRQDSFYQNSAPEKFAALVREEFAAFRGGNLGEAIRKDIAAGGMSLPALFEWAGKPIMEHVVPMQKLGVFGDMATKIMRELPADATAAERKLALQSAWDSVDNRLGQLVYDNLFWAKTHKDLAMASVRSVGWNLGTIRELGGGLVDAATTPMRLKAGDAALTHRMAYVMALPITVGMASATYQYLRTGEGPQELKDYFYPRTGEVDIDGNPERVQMASYMKDLFAYAKHPWQTVTNKIAPLPGTLANMLNNQNYYGDEIRNENDPLVQQAKQEAQFLINQFVPFGIRNAAETNARGDQSVATKAGNFVGITPAPREVVRSDAQNMMADIAKTRKTSGATPEMAEARKQRTDLLALLRANKNGQNTDAIQQKVTAAIESQQLTPADIGKLLKRAGTTPAAERFKTLTLDQAVAVFQKATPREQALFAEALVRKMERGMKLASTQEGAMVVP